MKLKSLVLLFVLTLFANVLCADAILNIDQPIRSLKVSSDQMKSAIVNAAQEQRWVVTAEGDGQLSATYHKSDYMAKIAIKYAPTFYTINYTDSKRMRYNGTSIHPTYNKLIKALQANIIRNLKAGDFTTEAGVTTVTDAPAKQEDDIRTKLVKIKKLHEDGLITKEEYDAKRKVLIDSY
ncbi:MAG: SHOCT domain-containing protein [Sulfurimonadaceae bacterium]